jgi:cell division protein ZapA (FtsZ GTPase activity inhibitor)
LPTRRNSADPIGRPLRGVLFPLEKRVTIELFGKPYTFQADTDPEFMQAVADTVVEHVQRVEAQQSRAKTDLAQMAILLTAALNLANELLALKSRHTQMVSTVTERAATLIQHLDAHLPTTTAGPDSGTAAVGPS